MTNITNITNTPTGEIIATIYSNHSYTMEYALDLIGAEIINPENPWDPNVITDDGREYYYDDLAFSDPVQD